MFRKEYNKKKMRRQVRKKDWHKGLQIKKKKLT